MKRISVFLLTFILLLSITACGTNAGTENEKDQTDQEKTETVSAETGEKIYRSADSWLYPSLNPHVDYQGWQSYGYGGIEMLYHIEDDGRVVPWLAEKCETNDAGKTWEITLNDKVHFSDGSPFTAKIVVENLKDIAEKNSRYTYLKDASFEEVDEKTVRVVLKEGYITFVNDLADPDTAIVKMGNGEDIDMSPVSTGPFVVKSFTPEAEVVMEKNDNYWNGEPKIDGAVFTYVPDADTQMMAMQNGEISSLYSPSATALEIFGADPDNYTIAYAATSRLYFYYLNCDHLSANFRAAINQAINADEFATIMNGLVETTVGPFQDSTAYGKAEKPGYDLEAAKAAMEADGYTMNADGYYEKDGEVPTLSLCYYPARSLDKLAALMQEQLRQVGIKAEVNSFEDPDSGYITTGNYDIGLYNAVAAPSGDPYYFLNLTMGRETFNGGGYKNEKIFALLDQMAAELDTDTRAELSNQIVKMAIDDNAYGYIGLTIKATVLQKGVSNVGESNPYHGGLNVNSTIE